MTAVFSITYAGPIEYYILLAKHQNVWLESKEHFVKQSFRNRCEIVGAQGPVSLIIPSIRKSRERTTIDEIKIANTTSWQTLHWRSICTAYRSSPFFEYYEAYLESFYLKPFENLMEFNIQLMELIIKKIGLNIQWELTNDYKKDYEILDYRDKISPKNKSSFKFKRYIQVFEDKLGFVPNLSVFDLLFNLGPASKDYLLEASKNYPS